MLDQENNNLRNRSMFQLEWTTLLKKTLLVVKGTAASIWTAKLSGFVKVLAKGKETFSGFVWRKVFALSPTRVGVASKNLSTLNEYSIWLRTRFVRFITKINCSTIEIKLLFLIVGFLFRLRVSWLSRRISRYRNSFISSSHSSFTY